MIQGQPQSLWFRSPRFYLRGTTPCSFFSSRIQRNDQTHGPCPGSLAPMRPSTAPPDGETRCRARLTFGCKGKILLIAPLASLAPGDISPMCPSPKALAMDAELEIKKRAALESAQGQTLGSSTRGTDFLLLLSFAFHFLLLSRHLPAFRQPGVPDFIVFFHFLSFIHFPNTPGSGANKHPSSKLEVTAFLVD